MRPTLKPSSPSALVLIVAVAVALSPGAARAGEITVFAAASLMTALDEVAALWRGVTGHRAVLSYAGTSALARQIEAGAPADVFVAADAGWMDRVAASGRVAPGSRVDLLGNELAIVAGAGSLASAAATSTPPTLGDGFDLVDRLGDGRLAMAFVDAVPAGIYGKAALESAGVWHAVRGRIAEVDNVRAALALVAVGAAPLGVVYATDAAAEPRVRVVARVDPASHPPIVYPAAVVAGGREALARDFVDFLGGDAARAAFARAGFAPLD